MYDLLLKRQGKMGVLAILVGSTAFAQSSSNVPSEAVRAKLSLKADLVLSPEFCATKKRQSITIKDVLYIGKSACPQLETALKGIFSDVRVVNETPAAGTTPAQVILIPKFVDISATEPLLPSSQRKLTILVEWTIDNSAGQPIWLQTIEGFSERKQGWIITGKRVADLVDDAVRGLAKESAAKMSSAPELLKLATK